MTPIQLTPTKTRTRNRLYDVNILNKENIENMLCTPKLINPININKVVYVIKYALTHTLNYTKKYGK